MRRWTISAKNERTLSHQITVGGRLQWFGVLDHGTDHNVAQKSHNEDDDICNSSYNSVAQRVHRSSRKTSGSIHGPKIQSGRIIRKVRRTPFWHGEVDRIHVIRYERSTQTRIGSWLINRKRSFQKIKMPKDPPSLLIGTWICKIFVKLSDELSSVKN